MLMAKGGGGGGEGGGGSGGGVGGGWWAVYNRWLWWAVGTDICVPLLGMGHGIVATVATYYSQS